jgi:general secretion pathway protein A
VTPSDQPERVEGYEPFFGLNEAPFSLAPDPRFLFASSSHSAALAQVAYALERREPLVVITGEIGTGKTLLCRTVLQQLRRKTFLSVINDPLLERDDLLKELLQDFGAISKDRTKLREASRHELIQTLQAFLRSLAPIQAHAVVIIDEAQHLQPDVLEQIRLLSNIDDERGTLLQIILVGQTDLESLLSRPELRQLQQRVSRRFRLEPLTRDEVKEYIEHRLALARDGKLRQQLPGATELARELADWTTTNAGIEFTSDAIHAVSELSAGLPRVINLLCDRSLEEAYASRLHLIDRPLILTAASALGVRETSAPAHLNVKARSTQVKPDESSWTVAQSNPETENPIAQFADEAAPFGFSARTRPAAAPRLARQLVLVTSLALAVLAVLFGVRRARAPAAQAPSSAAAPASSATPASSPRSGSAAAPASPASRTSSARSDSAPVDADASVPKASATAGTPTPPGSTGAAAPALAATSTSERFDIVVASFRTDARAAAVAREVAALGLPMRRRVSYNWQQVVSGPFASRRDAEEAQQRLHGAGLTGTQIVLILDSGLTRRP